MTVPIKVHVKWTGSPYWDSIDIYGAGSESVPTNFEAGVSTEVDEDFARVLILRGDFTPVDFTVISEDEDGNITIVAAEQPVLRMLLTSEGRALSLAAPDIAEPEPYYAGFVATVGVAFSGVILASEGTAPYTYTLKGGSSLPSWATLDTDGTLHGTPDADGTTTFTVISTDANGIAGELEFGIIVSNPNISVYAKKFNATQHAAFTGNIYANFGVGPYTYAVKEGDSVPTGLTLSASGVLSGTPTVAATGTFTVVATDANGCTGDLLFTFIGAAAPALGVYAKKFNGIAGKAFTNDIYAAFGTAPYTYAVKNGSTLPTGLALSAAGALTGTPTVAGTETFYVVATDANSVTGELLFSFICAAALPSDSRAVVAPVVHSAASLASPVVGSGVQLVSRDGLDSVIVMSVGDNVALADLLADVLIEKSTAGVSWSTVATVRIDATASANAVVRSVDANYLRATVTLVSGTIGTINLAVAAGFNAVVV
jgi:hypothetical protein